MDRKFETPIQILILLSITHTTNRIGTGWGNERTEKNRMDVDQIGRDSEHTLKPGNGHQRGTQSPHTSIKYSSKEARTWKFCISNHQSRPNNRFEPSNKQTLSRRVGGGVASAPSKLQKRTAGGVVVPKRSAESLESPPSSATASVKASFPTDVAATCDPDGEWAMSPPFVRSLSSCGGVGVGEAREVWTWKRSEPQHIYTDWRPKPLCDPLNYTTYGD